MKAVKFIAVFLCGAMVMAAMSCARSACVIPQNDDPASMTDIVSSADTQEVPVTDPVPTTTEASASVLDAPTETTATVSTQPPSEAAATVTTAATTSTATRKTTTATAAKTTTTARTTAATVKPTAASTTTKKTTAATTQTTTTTRTTTTAKPTTTTAKPTTTSTAAPTTAKPTTSATTAAPGFDIGKYSSYAKSYGQSIGLTYDSGVSSFDTPLILSAATTQPEKRIRDRLDGYAASGYTRFKVWTEQRESDGKWKLYIAYG